MSGPVEVRTAKIYVGGGKRFLTMLPAYRRAAWKLIREKHCDCTFDENGGKDVYCRFHRGSAYYGQRVVSRLVRIWLLRDKAPRAVYSRACLHQQDDWGRVPLPDESRVVVKSDRLYFWVSGRDAMAELRARHPDEYRELFLAIRAARVFDERRDR